MTEVLTPGPEDIIPAPAADPGEPEVVTGTIAGMQVAVRRPTDAQVVLLGRYARIIERTEAKAAGVSDEARLEALWNDALGRMSDALEIIEHLIVSDSDREDVEHGMRTGKIKVQDLTGLVKALGGDSPEPLAKQRKSNARVARR